MGKNFAYLLIFVMSLCLSSKSLATPDLTKYDLRGFYSDPQTANYWLILKSKLLQTDDAEVFFGKAHELQSLGVAAYWRSPMRGGPSTYTLTDGTILSLPGFQGSMKGEKAKVSGIRGVAELSDQSVNQELINQVTASKPFLGDGLLLPVKHVLEKDKIPYSLLSIQSTNQMLLLLDSMSGPKEVIGYIGVVGKLQPLGIARVDRSRIRGGPTSYTFADGSILTFPGFNNRENPISFISASSGQTTAHDLNLSPLILKQLMDGDCSSAVL